MGTEREAGEQIRGARPEARRAPAVGKAKIRAMLRRLGLAEQLAALDPRNVGIDPQLEMLRPPEGPPVASEPRRAAPPTIWSERVRERFADWDRDGDGHIGHEELDELMGDPAVASLDAAAVAALHEHIGELEELSDDELGDENDGLSRSDLAAHVAAELRKDPRAPASGPERTFSEGASKIANQERRLFADPSKAVDLKAVRQASLEDCSFLAAVAGVVARDDRAIEKMIRPGPDHTYTVTFPGRGTVTVDEPTDAEIAQYASSGRDGLWLPVLEKAYARVRSGPEAKDAYDALGAGELASEGIEAMTGSETDRDLTALTGIDETRAKLGRALGSGKLVTASIRHDNRYGLPFHHAYTVIGWDAAREVVTLRNPWGSGTGSASRPETMDEGIFELSLAELDDICFDVTYEQ